MGILSTGNIDGSVTPLADARIPISDRGFLYGDSVYEVFRTYEGVGFLSGAHWERLQNSAHLIHMEIPFARADFFDQIRRTILVSGAQATKEDVYVRYIVTRGDGPVDLFPLPGLRCRFVILVKELPTWKTAFYTEGLTLAIPQVRRNPSSALNPNIKGGNYLNNVLGIIEARSQDADDCLLLNDQGLATESSTSNVFFVIGDRIVTPYQSAGNLIGLTKQTILKICGREGIETAESAINVGDMREARECFLTSSTREVMPVRTLKFESGEVVTFPTGGGPLTRTMVGLYKRFVSNYVEEHRDEAFF